MEDLEEIELELLDALMNEYMQEQVSVQRQM